MSRVDARGTKHCVLVLNMKELNRYMTIPHRKLVGYTEPSTVSEMFNAFTHVITLQDAKKAANSGIFAATLCTARKFSPISCLQFRASEYQACFKVSLPEGRRLRECTIG